MNFELIAAIPLFAAILLLTMDLCQSMLSKKPLMSRSSTQS
jgi:hypothetical protein